ncbi:hypothetical protein EVAR_88770_1 [Eumeta japonica]|uniref:Uncharacterized protein n=1 Tax=Eumeta variegata TaxID=151549 RepID=A0A4C1XR64_EUMVA|nr:hypothetical protein EVAR_88770_1 [Eumeta japonica]
MLIPVPFSMPTRFTPDPDRDLAFEPDLDQVDSDCRSALDPTPALTSDLSTASYFDFSRTQWRTCTFAADRLLNFCRPYRHIQFDARFTILLITNEIVTLQSSSLHHLFP